MNRQQIISTKSHICSVQRNPQRYHNSFLILFKFTMDIIFIQGLKVDTVIGIYDWERKIRQEIVLDIEMSADISTAASTDNINQALNYKDICKRISSFVSDSQFQLVETLAEKICQIIIKEFGVQWVKLKLNGVQRPMCFVPEVDTSNPRTD